MALPWAAVLGQHKGSFGGPLRSLWPGGEVFHSEDKKLN